MISKPKIHSHYIHLLEEKIKTLRFQINDLAEDAQNDAKGSAGDKHETALSMMHLEQEKLNKKLKENLEQLALLESIDSSKQNTIVALGSLVITNKFTFYISSALPKTTIDNHEIIALSLQSPLGLAMKGKTTNESFSFNGIQYTIHEIY